MNTGVRLQAALEEIYANSSVLTTQSRYFDVLRYAQVASEPFEIRERKDLGDLKLRGYQPGRRLSRFADGLGAAGPPPHGMSGWEGVGGIMGGEGVRTQGTGNAFEQVLVGAYEVRWRGEDFLAIVGSVRTWRAENVS